MQATEVTAQDEQAPLVSVVVLAFNSAGHLGPCLSSLGATMYAPFEVFVVDNGSADESARLAAELTRQLNLRGEVVRLGENLGCAGGNNAGWRNARGEIIVFLNPDTEVRHDTITELVRPLLTDRQIGITGAKMYFPGTNIIQHAGGILHPNGMTDHLGARMEDQGQFDELREVPYVTGAGMAMRRSTLEQLGGFDESYFPAYFEEVDLCFRTRKLGMKVVYIPTARMVHHESVSLGADSPALRRLYSRMRVRFLLKNYSAGQIIRYSIPFEIRSMLHERASRGYRLLQLRAWLANLPLLLAKLLGMNRVRQTSNPKD